MKTKSSKRLPAVPSLSEILPKGTEGGKEFARIIDLLLFHESRRHGKKSIIFNDASGDYYGLDSMNSGDFKKDGNFGYQYKFYTSPLSDKNRLDIEKSIQKAAKENNKLNITKWILVTPNNLLESSSRKNGGDVTWFENLKDNLDLKFDCEHWGHAQILDLFLQAPHICLYYYPELVDRGAYSKKTIQQVRSDYNSIFSSLYRNIEFVGMSVYKPEATRGVPMEDIYIPLSIVQFDIPDGIPNQPRTNPIQLLQPGSKHVILGDPGSGKSTLLRFLSLVGTSEPLQHRYNAQPDDRLPVLVVLRRYADELKKNSNLSILDFVKNFTQADFSLRGADDDFFEYYLESGKAILCFDGLDELPGAEYKIIIRDRIKSFQISFPGNTVIITSRIIGYQEPFKFDEEEYSHFKVTKLQLPEIEDFVQNWYKVRIENQRERDSSISDLIRILRDQDHSAIRELAANPLLLTIVALVHRIDAVLPDERVVLYQKCTETLLNTWHTWKFKNPEIKNRGKIERRNKRRMEAIALWMHCQSGGTDIKQRAIVPFTELRDALSQHILLVEKPNDPDYDPEDLADDFLDFVRKRAGLLIEVGDEQYSFIHLTFQEYLASSAIITKCEIHGATSIWETIKDRLDDPRWHEVIRLLIAGLKAEESQEYLIETVLNQSKQSNNTPSLLLLGGLLSDGITAAESYEEEILSQVLDKCSSTNIADDIRPMLRLLSIWAEKESSNREKIIEILLNIKAKVKSVQKISSLFGIHMLISKTGTLENLTIYPELVQHQSNIIISFIQGTSVDFYTYKNLFKSFWGLQDEYTREGPFENMLSAFGYAITSLTNPKIALRRVFNEQINTLIHQGGGPFLDIHTNWLFASCANNENLSNKISSFLSFDIKKPEHSIVEQFDKFYARLRGITSERILRIITPSNLENSAEKGTQIRRLLGNGRIPSNDISKILTRRGRRRFEYINNAWVDMISQPDVYINYSSLLTDAFELKPPVIWNELITQLILPNIQHKFNLFNVESWLLATDRLIKNSASEEDILQCSWLVIFDIWLRMYGYRPTNIHNPIDDIISYAHQIDNPFLNLALCLHKIAQGEHVDTSEIEQLLEWESRDFVNLVS